LARVREELRKEIDVEQAEWMNEQVREEIRELQQRFGFEEREALAFWHFQQAGKLMNEMRHADVLAEIDREERRGQQPAGGQMLGLINDMSVWHTRVSQHLSALNRELGRRVLQRDYPEGWGSKSDDEEDEAN
jgi:hypothetical protein